MSSIDYSCDKNTAIKCMELAYDSLYRIPEISDCISRDHVSNSQFRITESIFEMFKGCWEDPDKSLGIMFDSTYDEIVYENELTFVSNCAHHNLPFFGKMYFGYLPDKKIVGLSKVPRLVRTYSRRPQVQEKLTEDIVNKFMEIVKPKGCGLVVEAYHLCMMIRGIEEKSGYTKTTALRGVFKTAESTKQEFLNGIRKTTKSIWP